MAGGRTAILAVRVVADATDAARGLDQTAAAAQRWERGLDVASRAAAATVAGLGLLATAAFDAASAQQQAAGAVESVYGDAADQVHELAAAAADTVGLATSEYSQFAAVLGAQLSNLGVAQEDLVGTQDELIRMAADLAATFGGTTAEAVEALSALFRGETDPIERYGVSIRQADVEARLAAQGLAGLTGEARTQAETQARLALLTEQTAAAQGAFAREADTAAGAQQRANAAWQNALAALGTALLPLVTQAAQVFAELALWIQQNSDAVTIAAVVLGGLAAVVLAVTAATRVWSVVTTLATAATRAWTAGQLLLNAALRANPIGLVITLVAGLIAAVVAAYHESETFRRVVDRAGEIAVAAFRAIIGPVSTVIGWIGDLIGWISRQDGAFRTARSVASGAISAIVTPIRTVIEWVADLADSVDAGSPLAAAFRAISRVALAVWDGIESAIETVQDAIDAVMDAIDWALDRVDDLRGAIGSLPDLPGNILGGLGDLIGMSAGSPIYAPSVAARSRAGDGPTIVQITVTGALDPDAVARQIESLLTARGLRTGALAGFGGPA